MKKKIFNFLKILVAIVLVGWLIQKLEWQMVQHELRDISYGYIFLFVFLQLLAMTLSAKKWQVIARYQNIHFTVWEGFKIYLTGTFINNFLPSTIGGDIYRSLWLTKKAETKAQAFSTVVFDRLLGLLATAFMALLGGIFVWQAVGLKPFLQVTYLGIVGFFVLFAVLFIWAPKELVARIPWQKFQNLISEGLRYQEGVLWRRGLLWTSAFVFVGLGLSNYVLFLALGYTLPFLPFLGLVFLMALYVSLPISINNIGIKEWAYGVLFVLLGVSFETAITVALLSRILQTGISLCALPIYLKETSEKIID